MDTIDDILGHGKGGGAKAVDDPSGGEAEDEEAALSVAGGAGCKGADGAWSHGFVSLFVGLDVLAKLILAVAVVVNSEAGE